jgi:anaerobic magnesium-protoporphyrin IX monomethyl ester cyclase
MTKTSALEKHENEADVAIVQMPLPIYEKELTIQERNMHTAYWNKLTELVPNKYFSPDRPIFNFMELGLGLPTLSGQIKSTGHSTGLIDLIGFSGSKPDFDAIKEIMVQAGNSKVFMLSPMTCGYDIFSDMVKVIKDLYPSSLVVAGGPHVSKLPLQTLEEIPGLDIVATNQKFTTQDLVRAIFSGKGLDTVEGIFYRQNGVILRSKTLNISSKIEQNRGEETPLDLDILPSRYSESSWGRIYTALGCAYNCAYCADILHKKKKPTVYDLDDVMAQVDLLRERFGVRLFYIGDETFTYYPEHAREFAERMGQRKDSYWIAQTRADCVDMETLETLAENNCIMLKIGAESGSDELLRLMRKGITREQIITATQMGKYAGLNIFTYWMTGLPEESPETIQKSMDFQKYLFESGSCDLAEDVIFVPYPGTEIYHNPHKFNVNIEMKPWAQWREDMPSVTNTRSMTSDQIYNAWLNKIDHLAKLIKLK